MKCGIDPGRYKIGFAIVENGKLLFSAIIPKSKEEVLAKAVKDNDWKLLEQWGKEGNVAAVSNMIAEKVLLGDGTSSNEIKSLLKETVNLEIVSEYETTLKGRELYWQLHSPKGLWKLIPTSLRTPARDIDDLAAWAIVNASTNLD